MHRRFSLSFLSLALAVTAACNQTRTARELPTHTDAGSPDVTDVNASEPDDTTMDAATDAALDAPVPQDAARDPEPDVPQPPDTSVDASLDVPAPEDTVDDSASDTAPDAPATPAPWVAFAGQSSNRENVQLVPLDGSDDPTTIYETSATISRVRFTPSGDTVLFLESPTSGPTSLVAVPLDTLAPELDPLSPFARVLGMAPLDTDAFVAISGSLPGDPTIAVHVYDRRTRTIQSSSQPAERQQHRAVVSGPAGWIYTVFEPPSTATLLWDGLGGRAPIVLTDGVDTRDDVAFWPGNTDGALLFTDSERRLCWVEVFPAEPVAPPFTAATCLPNTEEFHPRPTSDGCCVVSSRYRPEVSVRPSPRDIVVVDLATGEVVRSLTDTPLTSERWPDVQPRP